ncbi:hypothetical protein [Photobacterium leiognathi]|uniref:hypothetical protein n=1 Tax=Photobacterium leiognathi TaxID=553611 RepID=UPI00273915C7|nr:hypothetical protein [Photobacterium leiognathi]
MEKRLQFDRTGREVRNIHQSFDGRWVYVDQHWDNLGRKLRHSRPSFDKPDYLMSNVPHSQFSYDSLDRETYSKIPFRFWEWVARKQNKL